MSTIENYTNVVKFMSQSLLVFKAHIDYTDNIAGEFKTLFQIGKNLQTDYEDLIRSNSANKENFLNPTEIRIESNTSECLEKIKSAKNLLENIITDEPIEKLQTAWTLENGTSSQLLNDTKLEPSEPNQTAPPISYQMLEMPKVENMFPEDEDVSETIRYQMLDDGTQMVVPLDQRNMANRNYQKKIKKHMLSNGKRKQPEYKCDQCEASFNYKPALDQHRLNHTRKQGFPCTVCHKVFSQTGSLKMHMRLHTGEKPFACNECPKRFTQLKTLKDHLTWHTGEKPFVCHLCPKKFTQPHSLKLHMRLHTGDQTFKCDKCPQKFSQQIHLREHNIIHLREHDIVQPFKCEICPRSYSQLVHLTTHIRSHTGEKPFKCEVCAKMYAHSNSLKNHMRTHNGEGLFKCEICGTGFIVANALKAHMKVHK